VRTPHLAGLLATALTAGCNLYAESDDAVDPPPFPDARWSIDASPIDAPPPLVDGLPPQWQPFAPTKANVQTNGAWTEVGPADWTCLNTARTDLPSTGAVPISGRVTDFQTGNGVGATQIIAFPTVGSSTILGTTASSNVPATRGDYAMTLGQLPPGTTRYGFAMSATNYVSTYVLDAYVPPGTGAVRDLELISEATATALPAFIGVTRDTTRSMALGPIVDCQGRHVSNAVAVVGTSSGILQPITGAQTFYFSAGSSSLPVRPNVASSSNRDGLFVILDVPASPSTLFVQVWGYRDQAELDLRQLTLLAELPAPSLANTAVTATFAPRRF